MAKTPAKKVKWDDHHLPLLSPGSPYIDGPSVAQTSSLEYVNSQLVAHGFASSPGLTLDGLSNSALERAVKCLLSMLSQRIDDMSRTEDLSTKLRTLTYDHERLTSMHRTAMEAAAHAEREMNVHKSRSSTAMRSLQAVEAAHKQVTAELQRTRTMLQGIRALHQAEIKKREKEIERMTEKWSKLADAQAKLMTIPAGISCANFQVVTGSELVGKGQGLLEAAIEEGDKARNELLDENFMLRKLIVKTINRVRILLHEARLNASQVGEEPVLYSITSLFPLHPITNPSDKWNQVCDDLQAQLNVSLQGGVGAPDGDTGKLQNIIANLREELEQYKQHAATRSTKTQAMFDDLLRSGENSVTDPVLGPMSMPPLNEENECLENAKRDLEQERDRLTQASVRLVAERAELEAERLKLLDEKRSWKAEKMLAEYPPNPDPSPSPPKQLTTLLLSPKRSPRKGPAKVSVGKAGTGNKWKNPRSGKRSLPSSSKVIPSYETEVLLPVDEPKNPSGPRTSLLPTSFVLPPPTPLSSLPSEPALLPPLPALNFGSDQPPVESTTTEILDSVQPSTPSLDRLNFPVAKPFGQRMIHAYSPVKPSPLSRILLLGNSPNSPGSQGLALNELSPSQTVAEERESQSAPVPHLSLAAELGIPESPPERPSEQKATTTVMNKRNGPSREAAPPSRGKVFHPPVNNKSGTKTVTHPVSTTSGVRNNAPARAESKKIERKPVLATTKVFTVGSPTRSPAKSAARSKARLVAKLPPPSKDGPRRVLLDSDEAPPLLKARRK